jgi:hypothetical protein
MMIISVAQRGCWGGGVALLENTTSKRNKNLDHKSKTKNQKI